MRVPLPTPPGRSDGAVSFVHRHARRLMVVLAALVCVPVSAAELGSPIVEAAGVAPFARSIASPATAAAWAPVTLRDGPRSALGPDDGGRRFYRGYLLPRLNRQFHSMASSYRSAEDLRPEGLDHGMRQQQIEIAERQAVRGTRKALKEFLLEVTQVEAAVDRWLSGERGSRSDAESGPATPTGGPRSDSRLRFGLRIHSFEPKAEMRYRVGPRTLRLSLSASGSLGVEFRNAARTHTRLYAGYDAGEGDYGLGARFVF